ncbi:TonB-dependent siderophore receptor [Cupriavidus oxalaticus]|uniref:TonB-dependent siderophore receptor n=1 Tax=Cupriavidus oxalaticus TaxID=96344 RepID=A0A4P7L3Q7_9BURK|nr:TonB-dependent siderophore receptor [Cupriavidus oxalaticus]QBY50098.1 TonB-dependent siderophore receptor [Cupriavidus oxalaticus]
MLFRRLAIPAAASSLLLPPVVSHAADELTTLPSVTVSAASDGQTDVGFATRRAAGVTKSGESAADAAQSITVITRDLLDSQQAQNLSDALQNSAGVVTNAYGRRGWDDFIIRGQRASESIFADGLLVDSNNRVAQELFGVERVEVLKGPASILFGAVQPGGLVNMVSKRPRAELFGELGLTVGNYGFRQMTVDVGTPLARDSKAAFRLNALLMNSDDPTDYVWYRNRWIAPSLTLDLGTRTDFTILASHNQRNYVRQQGLPVNGTLVPNRNGVVPSNRFIGEPNAPSYDGEQNRIGYALTHRFDSGWTLNQNLRYQASSLTGTLVSAGTMAVNSQSMNRSGTQQSFSGNSFGVDTNVQRTFAFAGHAHSVTFGVDYRHTKEDRLQKTCRVAALNVYNPVYGASINCPSAYSLDATDTLDAVGLYLRDQIRLAERWTLTGGVRYESARTSTSDRLASSRSVNDNNAVTGSAGVMYELTNWARPYASFATSFLPNAGTDVSGATFQPEKGRQYEVGIKFDMPAKTGLLTLAAFDLTRTNVLSSDPVNTGFSMAVGEQRSRGLEVELTQDLGNGLSVSAAYAYIASEVTEDTTAANVGKPLNSVPRHSFSVWSQYRLRGALAGWYVGAGLRGESAKRGYSFNYTVPGYTVADLAVGYVASHWRAAFNVKNVFDKMYYAGGLNNNVLPVGNPRVAMLNVTMNY